MQKVFIHIGTHKTGTTSIQSFLSNNRNYLLENGFFYPKSGSVKKDISGGQHQLSFSIRKTAKSYNEKCWDDFTSEINNYPDNIIIISSEDFGNMNSQQIKQLRSLLLEHEVFIILYLRNYYKYMRAVYSEVIKNRKVILTYKEFIDKNQDKLDYNSLIKAWAYVFGEDNIIIRIYDKILANGNLLENFCKTIYLKPPPEVFQVTYNKNPTFDERTTNAIRLMHLFGDKYIKNYSKGFFIKFRRSYLHKSRKYRILRKLLYLIANEKFVTQDSELLIETIVRKFDKNLLLKYIDDNDLKYLNTPPI